MAITMGAESVAVRVGVSVKVSVEATAGVVAAGAGVAVAGAGVVESGVIKMLKAVGSDGSEATGTGYPRLGTDVEKW